MGDSGGAHRCGQDEPRPAGFPACRRCAYRTQERPSVCLGCLEGAIDQRGSPTEPSCPVCEQTLEVDGACANDWCGRADRWFSMVWSVAPHIGSLRRAIGHYKYRGEGIWAEVFGRLLLGFLDDRMPWFDEYDLLLSVPAYTGPGARRRWDHVGRMTAVTQRLAGPRWPFSIGVIDKVSETPPMTGRNLSSRRAIAEGPLRRALRVVAPERVAGGRILVVDDVFTEGSTLREVARALVVAGAEEVAGLTLARQPWGPRCNDTAAA